MLKKILLIIAILALVVSGLLYYVNQVLLPVQMKDLIVKNASAALHRKVTLDRLHYDMLRGFVLQNLTVYSPNDQEEVFLHADSVAAGILFPALLQKKIIIPSLHIDGLAIRLVRSTETTWNFSDLMAAGTPAAADAKPAPQSMEIVVSSVNISKARLKLTDLVGSEPFSEMVDIITVNGGLSLSSAVKLNGEIAIPSTSGTVGFNLQYGLLDKKLRAELNINNIQTSKYFRFAPSSVKLPVKTLDLINTRITLSLDNNSVQVSGNIQAGNIDAQPLPGTRLRAAAAVNQLLLTNDKNGLRCQGNADVKITSLETPAVKNISGDISTIDTVFFLNEGQWELSTDAAVKKLSVAANTDQALQAELAFTKLSAKQTSLGITASADISATNLSAVIPGTNLAASFKAPATAFSLKNGTLDLTFNPNFSNLSVTSTTAGQKIAFSGTPKAAWHIIAPQDASQLSYNGAVDLINGVIKGLPYISEIAGINGKIDIKNNEVSSSGITLTALESPIRIKGKVKDFSRPSLAVTAEANDIDLGLLPKVIPQILADNALTITGTTDVTAEINGPLSDIDKGAMKIKARLKQVNIASDKLKQALKNINGKLTYRAPQLVWEQLTADFQEKTYSLNGSLTDPANPHVSTTIKTENLNADLQIRKLNETIALEKVILSSFDSNLTAEGKIFLSAKDAPSVDITLSSKTVLRDLAKILPQYAKQIDPLKLSGILQINAQVKGNPVKWQYLDATFNIETPAMTALGYKVDNLSWAGAQNNGTLSSKIKGGIYSGGFSVSGNVDLTQEDFPVDAAFSADDINLEQLKRDTPLKTQQISGTIKLNGELKGIPSKPSSLAGKAEVSISDGSLLDLQMLPAAISFLYETVRGNNTVITDASASLTLEEGRIATNNLTLKNIAISLIGEGWINIIDQTVDMNITPRLEPAASMTNSTGALTVLNPTQGLVNVHIGGTLSKPKIDKKISTPTVIKKTLQNTVGNLLKMFE